MNKTSAVCIFLIVQIPYPTVTVNRFSSAQADTTNTEETGDTETDTRLVSSDPVERITLHSDGKRDEIVTGGARSEQLDGTIDLQINSAYGVELEDSGNETAGNGNIELAPQFSDTIAIQSNDAYGVELEGGGTRTYENVLEFI